MSTHTRAHISRWGGVAGRTTAREARQRKKTGGGARRAAAAGRRERPLLRRGPGAPREGGGGLRQGRGRRVKGAREGTTPGAAPRGRCRLTPCAGSRSSLVEEGRGRRGGRASAGGARATETARAPQKRRRGLDPRQPLPPPPPPFSPVHESTIGPPLAGSEQRDDCASLTPPEIAALVSPPPRNADASDDVIESHAHPLAANWRSWRQHESDGSAMLPASASIAAHDADAYLAAYDLKVPARLEQGPVCSWEPSREQVMESAGEGEEGRVGGGSAAGGRPAAARRRAAAGRGRRRLPLSRPRKAGADARGAFGAGAAAARARPAPPHAAPWKEAGRAAARRRGGRARARRRARRPRGDGRPPMRARGAARGSWGGAPQRRRRAPARGPPLSPRAGGLRPPAPLTARRGGRQGDQGRDDQGEAHAGGREGGVGAAQWARRGGRAPGARSRRLQGGSSTHSRWRGWEEGAVRRRGEESGRWPACAAARYPRARPRKPRQLAGEALRHTLARRPPTGHSALHRPTPPPAPPPLTPRPAPGPA